MYVGTVSIHDMTGTPPAKYTRPGKPKLFTPELRTCAIESCRAPFYTSRRTPDKRYCSPRCAGLAVAPIGSKRASDNRRGCNPDRHIEVRHNGKREKLHRVIMAEYIGRPLLPYPEEIVHHRDRDKHHNCVPGKIMCGALLCEGNLELLSGDAAAEHMRIHAADLLAGRYGKEPYNFEDGDGW